MTYSQSSSFSERCFFGEKSSDKTSEFVISKLINKQIYKTNENER